MPKKKWTTPQLIVLVRGKPEELVLADCRKATSSEVSMNSTAGGCALQAGTPGDYFCWDCSGRNS